MYDVCKCLIDAGANVNARSSTGATPLIVASFKNSDYRILEMLLKAGADVNASADEGITPLICAARSNTNFLIIKTLIQAGADVNARMNDGTTPLMSAATDNPNPQVLEMLINAGADVNSRSKDGSTALLLTTLHNSNPEILNILIKAGADVNVYGAFGVTPLMGVAQTNTNPEALKILIKAGADVNASSDDRFTPLMASAFKNPNPQITEMLIKAGADVNARNEKGGTPLLYAIAGKNHKDIVKTLIENNADVNACDNARNTPLMLAAKEDLVNMFEILLDAGADPDIKDNFGKSIFDYHIQDGLFNELADCILSDSKKVSTAISLIADSAFEIVESHLKSDPLYKEYKSYISDEKLKDIVFSLSFIFSSNKIEKVYCINNSKYIFFDRYGWQKKYKTSCVVCKKMEKYISDIVNSNTNIIPNFKELYKDFIYTYLFKGKVDYKDAVWIVNNIFITSNKTVLSLLDEMQKITPELIQK